MLVREILDAVLSVRIDWSAAYCQQLRIAVKLYEAFCAERGQPPKLHVDTLRDWMRWLQPGRTRRTVNDKRSRILAIWSAAYDAEPRIFSRPPPGPRELRKLKNERRRATAWGPDQFDRLLKACLAARERRGWGPLHWEAWVMVAYESSLRYRTMRELMVWDLDPETGLLSGPAEAQKKLTETVNRLTPKTVALVLGLDRKAGDDRLFPIPCHPRTLHRWFKSDVLKPGGLPASRRDMFHKLRRTSYTRVYAKFGLRAAMKHAGHATDMSRYYLDETQLDEPDPLDALRRGA